MDDLRDGLLPRAGQASRGAGAHRAGGREDVVRPGVRMGRRPASPRLAVRTLGGVFNPRSGSLLSPTPQSSRGRPLVGHRLSADTQRAAAAAPDEEPWVPGCKHTNT